MPNTEEATPGAGCARNLPSGDHENARQCSRTPTRDGTNPLGTLTPTITSRNTLAPAHILGHASVLRLIASVGLGLHPLQKFEEFVARIAESQHLFR